LIAEEDAIRIKYFRLQNGEIFDKKAKYILIENNLQNYFELNPNQNFCVEFIFRIVGLLYYDN
jgi:hypothetical protein